MLSLHKFVPHLVQASCQCLSLIMAASISPIKMHIAMAAPCSPIKKTSNKKHPHFTNVGYFTRNVTIPTVSVAVSFTLIVAVMLVTIFASQSSSSICTALSPVDLNTKYSDVLGPYPNYPTKGIPSTIPMQVHNQYPESSNHIYRSPQLIHLPVAYTTQHTPCKETPWISNWMQLQFWFIACCALGNKSPAQYSREARIKCMRGLMLRHDFNNQWYIVTRPGHCIYPPAFMRSAQTFIQYCNIPSLLCLYFKLKLAHLLRTTFLRHSGHLPGDSFIHSPTFLCFLKTCFGMRYHPQHSAHAWFYLNTRVIFSSAGSLQQTESLWSTCIFYISTLMAVFNHYVLLQYNLSCGILLLSISQVVFVRGRCAR